MTLPSNVSGDERATPPRGDGTGERTNETECRENRVLQHKLADKASDMAKEDLR